MNNQELEQSYLLTLFLRFASLAKWNYKDGEVLMQDIDDLLKQCPQDVYLLCLRGLVQQRYWQLDYEYFFEKYSTNNDGEHCIPFYRRRLEKDYKKPSYFFSKALEIDPDNKIIEKFYHLNDTI